MKRLLAGVSLVLLAAALPLVLTNPADAAVSYSCTYVQDDGDAVFTFSGEDVGTSANLRNDDGWVATVTNQSTYTDPGGAEKNYFVKLNSKRTNVTCEDVTVQPAPDLTCSTLIIDDGAIIYFWGAGVGAATTVRVDGVDFADATGDTSVAIADGASSAISAWLPASRTLLSCDELVPGGYSCTSLIEGADARLFFWGRDVTTTAANVLDSDGWIANVSDDKSFVAPGGANETHIVKLHDLRTAVACDSTVSTDFACSVSTNGDSATLDFSGAIGTSANVLQNGTWIQRVTGETRLEVADGAADSFIVKLHSLRTAVACLPGGPRPFGQSGDWVLDFEDEFDGTELDLEYWEPVWYDNGGFQRSVNDREDACYHRDQVSVADGLLHMTISEENDPACQTKSGEQAFYAGVQITSRNSRNQQRYETTSGYIETRMFLPSSNGDLHNWPGFWINGRDWPTQGEMDVIEGLRERQPCASFHWQDDAGRKRNKKWCPEPKWDEPGGWHIFAADWSEGSVTYYYDGVAIGTAPAGSVTNEPHFLAFQYTVNTEWGPAVTDTAYVDYVRVFKPAEE